MDARLTELGLTLPDPPAPAGSYVPFVREGDLLFLAGGLPMQDGKVAFTGAIGTERSIEEGVEAARLCALNQLAVAKSAVGSLARIRRVVTLTGFVWGAFGFPDAPKVINGASDLYGAVFGEIGQHARAAVTVAGLPLSATVEVQTVFALYAS
jgi:enamine deaminase RidA (YjgF/YER057c/UK114 family)